MELDALGRKHATEEQLKAVKTAENPGEAFDSWIDHWEDKFAEAHDRPIPDDQRAEISHLSYPP